MAIQATFILLFLQVFLGREYLVAKASFESVNHGLHCIDKRSTTECGVVPNSCSDTCFRSFDGSCNNQQHHTWGTPFTRYNRLIEANYGDGVSTPTRAISGGELPSARKVSDAIYPELTVLDPVWTLLAMNFGQYISHDMSLLFFRTGLTCCTADGKMINEADRSEFCFPIPVESLDLDYGIYFIKCLPFSRTITDKDRGCIGDRPKAEQLTRVTSYLDLSHEYGNNEEESQNLRTYSGGKLKTDIKNGQEMLPINPQGACTKVDPDEPCYLAGDLRVNQNPHLVILHTLYAREHNRIATILAGLNPLWDDECLFNVARKINIAQFQHITYYEWLPIFINRAKLEEDGIIVADPTNFVDDYDSNVDATVLNEHATAAFRFFHSMIAGHIDELYESRVLYNKHRISDHWNRPQIVEEDGAFDGLTRGMCTQPEYGADENHDAEITNYWVRPPNKIIGQDLKAICIQRNRDHGLASYNQYRVFCGKPKATSFLDLQNEIPPVSLLKLMTLYKDVNDIEVTVGGSLESLESGSLVGPTFSCIIRNQFLRTRRGDRYWFENSGKYGFTLEQLNSIRKSTISSLICQNAKDIKKMQPEGFRQILTLTSLTNFLKNCDEIPSTDLNLWKDTDGKGCGC